MTFYCSADNAGPRERPDWGALYRAAGPTDEDRAPVDALRVAEPGHIARNGNGPRTSTLTSRQAAQAIALLGVVRGSEVDEHGGSPASLGGDGVIGKQLLCPECLAPVRVCDALPEGD